MKLNLTYLFLAALLLGGCAKDTLVENVTKEETTYLQLSATNTNPIVISKADLGAGVNIGIYVADANTVNYVSQNQNYASGDAGALSPFNGTSPISLTLDKSYDIYAYAPFKAGVTDATAIPVAHGDDVLWTPVRPITKVSKTNCSAVLDFQHRGAQISFKVKFADDFTAGSKVLTADSKIEVSGFYNTGTLKLADGVITPTGAADKKITSNAALVDGVMTLGIATTNFLPSVAAMPLVVKITHESRTYTGNISAIFATATSNEYTVTVSGTSPNLGVTGTLAPWTTVTGNISASE